MKFEDIEIGAEVFYVPRHAKGRREHPSSEPGRVYRKHKTRKDGVYVRYYQRVDGKFTEELEATPKFTECKLLMPKEGYPHTEGTVDASGTLNFPDWPLD